MAWLGIVILGAIFATNANAQAELDKLRACLTIEDGSKERLDCSRWCCPTRSETKTTSCEGVADCKFLKEEDERLGCFNRFLVQPAPPKAARKVAPKAQPSK